MEEVNEDWENCCPLCMEEMDSTDRQLKPCRCGYQICVWCWNHIMEMAEKDSTEGRCPACRTPYDKEKIVSTAISCDRLGEANERKQKTGKAKTKTAEGRKNLSNVRVIQRNLVYVVGIPAALADEETLERKEYFGQYGRILKISVSKTGGHSSAGPSVGVYVTYVKEEDAMRCIQSVNGYVLDGKGLKACFGTTKYCNAWLKHMPCNNPDCLYLHDEGTREDSFTKEEMLAKYGSKNQQFHDLTHPPQRRSGIGLPPPVDAPSFSATSSTSQNLSQNTPTVLGSTPKAVPLVVNLPKSSSLPAAASWGSRSSGASRPASGRSIVGPPPKPKTGAGLINLATIAGSCTSGQSIGNVDGVKHLKVSNADGAQTSVAGASRLLERNHSAAETSIMIQTDGFTSDADDATTDKDISRQLFDGLISHKRNLSGAEAKDHTYGSSKEMKIAGSASSYKFSDAEESNVVVDIVEGKGLTKLSPAQDTCVKSSMGLLTPMPFESRCINQEDTGILKDPDSKVHSGFHLSNLNSTDSGAYADSQIFSRKAEAALQQDGVKSAEACLVSDKSFSSQKTSERTVLPPSNTSGLTILSRPDHAIASNSHHPCEQMPCNIPSLNPRSNSVHSMDMEVFVRNEATVPSEDTVLAQKSVWKSKADEVENSRKEPLNGVSEHELISDMFSTGFDLWTEGSPQDLAQLLKKVGSPATSAQQESTTSWKAASGSRQSRFHFARQDEVNEQTLSSGNDQQPWSDKHNRAASGNAPAGLIEVSASEQFLNRLPASAELYGGTPLSYITNSKSPMMAPPGFSPARVSGIPPGFSQHKATDLRRFTDTSHDLPRSLAPTNSFNHLEAANISADVEFIDPAIMAVGKGKLPAGSRTNVPFANPSMPAFLSQNGPLSQQTRPPLDFETSYQTQQDRPYRNYGSMNSTSHLGYANQDLDTSSSSLFHSSFNDAISQSRLMGQYQDAMLPHVVMQESVYANGGHVAPRLRYHHSTSDDWNRLPEVNVAEKQSVNDVVGRLAMSQRSLDRALQNRLEELSLNKDISSKYFGDATVYDEQGPLSTSRLERYF